jgi:hypothetical protein
MHFFRKKTAIFLVNSKKSSTFAARFKKEAEHIVPLAIALGSTE